MAIQGRCQGFVVISGPNGRTEKETFTCGHHGGVVIVEHGGKLGDSDVGEFCLVCMKPICVPCNAEMNRTRKCVPTEARLERAAARQEARNRLFAAIGI